MAISMRQVMRQVMQQVKRWAGVLALIGAVVVPTVWRVPLAAAGRVEVEQGGQPAAQVPRFHADGPLDSVPTGQRDTAWQELIARLDDEAAMIPQRPPVDPVQQMQTTAAWTVLVFIAADNNLEAAGLIDVNEMELVGSSPDVNIVVELDRSAEYADFDGDWAGTRRYYIQQDQDQEVINSTLVQDVGEVNSGDANAVADFAIWGITTFPAQKTMLVLWDHGGGWIVHSSDEDTGDDITLPELTSALDRAVSATGIGQFEVVGFDMCLMGQIEVFQTIAPYARYGIGSQEVEPGLGWFYTFLDELVRDPGMGGAALSAQVVDYYMKFYNEIWTYETAYGLGAVDLAQMGAMTVAVDQFAATVAANPKAALSPLADARNNVISYGGFDDPQYYDIWSSVDLYRFGELLNGITNVPELQTAAQGVMQAIQGFVIREGHNDALEGSHGLSIYFPRTIKAYQIGDFNVRYPDEVPADMVAWVNFLDVFHGTATATVTTAPQVSVTGLYPDVASIYQPAVISLDVAGRDILQVNYAVTYLISENERVVLDYDYLVSRTTTPGGEDIVNWSDGVTTRTFTWEAEVPVLSDGTISTYALLIPNRENPDTAVVNGEYVSVRGGDPVEAQLIFDLNRRQSTALWGITESANGSLQPFQLQIETGDQFRPLWLTLDANNDLSSTSYGDVLTLNESQPITFEKVPAPSGTYSISFVAENVAGETTLSEAIIAVNNDNLDAARRGYTDLTFGVNFLYPATWIRPRFTPDGARLFTADLATNTLLSVFPYTGVDSAEATNAAVRASWNALDNLQVIQERQVEINGLPTYVTDYSYTFQGEQRLGVVVAIYVPEQGVGYGFDIDAPAANPGPAQEALAALVQSINFFPAQQVVGQSAWQTVTVADGLVSFPIPADWVSEEVDVWTLFGPPDSPSIFVGLGAAPASGQPKEVLSQYWVEQLEASVTDLQILAAEPYYVGNQEWALVVFTYQGQSGRIGGAFFATTVGLQDYIFWIEAPDAQFDQVYADIFSVTIGGFTFNG